LARRVQTDDARAFRGGTFLALRQCLARGSARLPCRHIALVNLPGGGQGEGVAGRTGRRAGVAVVETIGGYALAPGPLLLNGRAAADQRFGGCGAWGRACLLLGGGHGSIGAACHGRRRRAKTAGVAGTEPP